MSSSVRLCVSICVCTVCEVYSGGVCVCVLTGPPFSPAGPGGPWGPLRPVRPMGPPGPAAPLSPGDPCHTPTHHPIRLNLITPSLRTSLPLSDLFKFQSPTSWRTLTITIHTLICRPASLCFIYGDRMKTSVKHGPLKTRFHSLKVYHERNSTQLLWACIQRVTQLKLRAFTNTHWDLVHYPQILNQTMTEWGWVCQSKTILLSMSTSGSTLRVMVIMKVLHVRQKNTHTCTYMQPCTHIHAHTHFHYTQTQHTYTKYTHIVIQLNIWAATWHPGAWCVSW